MPAETQRAYTILDKPVCHLWRANESDKIDINDLHQRTGHMGIDYLKYWRMRWEWCLGGEELEHCKGCAVAKAKRNQFRKAEENPPKEPIERTHCDVLGPFPVETLKKERYAFLFVDGYKDKRGQRRQWLKLTGNNTADTGYYAIDEVIKEQVRDFGKHMKTFRTENGGEFTSDAIRRLLLEKEIKREKTCPDSPEENGINERAIATMVTKGLCVLAFAGL